jgi:MraZ protein
LAFRGTFEYTLDAKNRLTVPAKLRPELAGGVVVAKGVEPCVSIWPRAGYEAFTSAQLGGFHPASADYRRIQRFYSANAVDTELDSAGRVMVPAFLIEHAGLDKDVVVTGAVSCLEVWDRRAWAAYNAELTGAMSSLSENVGHPS